MAVKKAKGAFGEGKSSFRKKVFLHHRPVLTLMFLSVPVSLFYAQLESNYRLYLETLFDDFLFTLTIYTVCRALLSITMQIPLVNWTEGLNIKTIVSISYVCYAVAAIGFAFSSSIFWLLSTAVLFTAAESMLLNHMQTFVSRLAPDHMRGRYFAFFGLHWDISRTIGPF
ncbi:MFS transporter [Bacillus licheniformis]